jgi:hypothetical protein
LEVAGSPASYRAIIIITSARDVPSRTWNAAPKIDHGMSRNRLPLFPIPFYSATVPGARRASGFPHFNLETNA